MTTIREMLEVAEALREQALYVFVDVTSGTMLVSRDGRVIGTLQFPVDDGDEDE